MKILVHDYSGHPFQVQLSRELSRRGHDVHHFYSASFQTPKGSLLKLSDDPESFQVTGLRLSAPFAKSSFFKRRRQEIEYGKLLGMRIRQEKPDVVISSNAPLDAQFHIQQASEAIGTKFVFWLQDIYGEAILRLLSVRVPGAGHAVGLFYRALEYNMLRRSDAVVAISADFETILKRRGVKSERTHVVENWAPLDEIKPLARDNPWALAHMPAGQPRVVYSGTLGYKHNPSLLLQIAVALPCQVLVYSEGVIADQLARDATSNGVGNLIVKPWVKFEELDMMLSGADIFIAMIEEDAGVFSVPSKVLTYMCVGRPIVAAIPEGNLARKIILRERIGLVRSPSKTAMLVQDVADLLANPQLRDDMGRRARGYARSAFDIKKIGDRFETIIRAAC